MASARGPTRPHEYPFGRLGHDVKKAIKNDFDVKIIIVSHNSKPGLSKTTLAIQMAREWDPHGWSAEEKAYMDPHEYREAYRTEEPGSVLLFDEIERAADNRRAMSKENVQLSQDWASLRYRNMVSIVTLPTTSMLDNRMLEMSDYWIRVVGRGQAWPYEVRVNDFSGKVWRERMGADENAVITYPDLEDDDDYDLLKQMKAEDTRDQEEYITLDEARSMEEKARKQAATESRNNVIRDVYSSTDISYSQLGESVGLSTQRIGQIVKDN